MHERRHEHGRESICPVCGYDGLDEPAFDERGIGSDDICLCCGFQPGLDGFPYEDRERLVVEWRGRRVARRRWRREEIAR